MPYEHFTTDERKRTEGSTLQGMTAMGLPKSYIARILGKHQSSVYRELNRNSETGVYTGREAQYRAEDRRRETKPRPKRDNKPLMGTVLRMFKNDLSPEQIAGRLQEQNPEMKELRVSTETIYQYLYQETVQDKTLKRHFRHPRPCRRRRDGRKERRGQIPDRTGIENRPEIVGEKTRLGDWEGDTVEGAGKSAYIATFVDRATKMLRAIWMPDKTAQTLNKAALRAFRPVLQEFIKTLTVDNGKEFSAHQALTAALGCPAYFAHPYHSWERGLNEHTNGLIRQYLPKGTSFDTLTQKRLDKIVSKINNRPRKSLGYRTPYEVFSERKFALQI